MRILLYEFITGGGMYSVDPTEAPSGSLLREGAAMIRALANDFAEIQGTQVVVFQDERLDDIGFADATEVISIGSAEQELRQLASLANAADWTIVIAPEFNNLLLNRVRHVEQAAGRMLSPGSTTVGIAHDKHAILCELERCGVATPRGQLFHSVMQLPQDLSYPVVVKPLHGAGSQGIRLVVSPDSSIDLVTSEEYRVEEYCPGIPASVSVLCGPDRHVVLPAVSQQLSTDGTFGYLGGSLPLSSELADRATNLASAVTRALPDTVGFIGIDIVLAEDIDGSDVVIEVNPRLTTSYVGLRELATCNLAQAMLDVAQGNAPHLSFGHGPVEFQSDGTIVRQSPAHR